MTREEALRRLEGTWSFEIQGDRVVIRDLELLSAVAAIRRERPGGEPASIPGAPLHAAAASGD